MTDTSEQLIEAFDDRTARRSERREFFKTALGATAIAAAGAAALGWEAMATAQTVTDPDVFNFALNLEYLEANFFSWAAYGTGISSDMVSGTGTLGTVSGGKQVPFTDPAVQAYAREIAQDEINHVNFLRTVLGSSAVAQPAIDLSAGATSAFSTLAQAAKIVAAGTGFDAFANDTNFLLAAFIIEDVVASAYKGLVPLISTTAYMQAASGVLATEAYHAATIRSTLYSKGAATASYRTSADAISDARDALDGTTDLDQGVSPVTPSDGSGQQSNVTPTDTNGLVYSRSYGQALNVLYLSSAAATKGGFFPNGVNGTLNASTGTAS